MVEALLIAIIIVAVVWVVAHLCVRYLPIPAEVAWLVYLVAIILTVVVLYRVLAPALGPLPCRSPPRRSSSRT